MLDAAIHIAGTLGTDQVTYRSVAARIGVAHSLVRFHFGTREAMLTAAFERAARHDAAAAHLRADDVSDLAGDLVALLADDPARQLLQYDFLLRAARGHGSLPDVAALYDHYIAQVAATLDSSGIDDPDGSLADLVFAALDGLVLQHFVYGDSARTQVALDRMRALLSGA
nr:TetR/AcrR family transcriptional regulator [Nocardioides kongjuensis]